MDSDSAPPSDVPGGDARYEAFVRLLVEHEPRLRGYLRGLLPAWEDVDEVTQNASLVAWRKFDQFQEGTSFGGWLLTIARFEALKHRRNLARSPLIFEEDIWEKLAPEADEELEGNAIKSEALEHCLSKLPPAQRTLILKAHSPGVRIRDLARSTGASEQAFYKAMQRTRAALLSCIEQTLAREHGT